MAKIVELPDGREAEFPDDMDNAAIAAVLRKQFAPSSSAPGQIPIDPNLRAPAVRAATEQYGDRPISDQISGGIFEALNKAAIGLKGLIPGVETTDDDRRRLEQHGQFVQGTGPASSIASVGTDVALSAMPVAKASQFMAKAAPRLLPKAAARYAPAAAEVAANAGYAAATAPENRGTAAMYGGGGAAGGRVLTRTLGGAVRPSTEAQKLLDIGVPLTPGQAGKGAMGTLARFSEGAASPVPLVGSSIKNAQQKAVETWNNQLAEHATLQGDKLLSEAIRRVTATAPVIKRGGVFFPQELALAAHRVGYPDLYQHAAEMAKVFGSPSNLHDTVKNLGRVGTMAAASWPLSVAGAAGHAAALPPAAMAILSSFDGGRKFLLGQYPLQKFVADYPDVAAQVARAMATQQAQE